ncbi:tandem-95 repeat protein [Pacificispira sp.]|uniref:tandem-95 repeat protein n=1 Tax=Pacificispira sp. TaxID=2888761 RepID=UPI003B51A59B
MADDLQQDQAGAELPVVPRLPDGDFEGVLTALAGGADAEEALGQLKATVRQSILDAGGSEDAADHAATSFIDTFRSELFEENGSLADAADYADQAMRTAMETYDPAAQAVDPSDALLAAIASGNGVEEAVGRVVAEMGGDMSEADSDRVEGVFLDELQAALSRGESPDAAVAAASQAAETGLDSLKQAEVPVDNPVLSALAGGENVGDALADAAQRSGGDADAFIDGLENALADGADANQAMNDAQQAAADSAQARQDSEVELGAADQLAAALASGQKVDEALEQTGGGDAFASALEDALANGAGAGDAMAQADDAQARQDAVAQEQSVPLSPADQLAASLASGENVDQAMQAAGGDDTFAASLEQSLAEGAAPDAAMQSGQQASANAQETQQQQSVPLSPADQLAASLASGQQVDEALQNAGGGDAFGSELEASLAAGETPDQSMASAGAAQQSADTTSSQQEVPADPAVQALAQGGGASGQDLADAVADVTGTTGEPAPQSTQSGEPTAPTQTAETTGGTGEQPAQQGAGSEPQAPATQSAETQPAQTQSTPAQSGGETQQQQTAQETQEPAGTQEPAETQTAQTEPSQTGQAQTETGGQESETAQQGTEQEPTQTAQTTEGPGEEIVESVDDVAEAPADTTPDDTDASTDDDVTQAIETASGEAAQDAGTGQTGDDTAEGTETQQTPIAQGGGGDQPTDEEIEALQDIATAAGGNSSGSPSSNLGFNQLLNPTIGNSGLGGGNTQQTTQTQTTTTTTGSTGGGGSDRDTNTVVDNTTTTINSAPVAVDDRGTTQENSVLTVAVTGNDSDPDNDAINVTAARILQANSGTVTFNGGSVTFEPGTDFDDLAVNESRDVNISYTIADNSGATSTATLTVRVTGTNDVPTVSQAIDAGTTDEDALNPIQIDLLSVASDVDTSDDLDTESVVVTSSDGRPVFFDNIDETGALTIDPAQFGDLAVGEHVVLTVSYNVVDGNGGVVANTATVTIEGRNDAPMVVGIVRTATEDGGAVSIDLLGNEVFDVDFTDVLTAQSLVQNGGRDVGARIENGALVFDGDQFEDLDDGEFEVLTFTYDVFDGTTTTQNTVTITVTASNDAPVVTAVVATRAEDSGAVSVDLLAGQTDVDGEPLTAETLVQTAGRDVDASIDANGNLIFAGGQFDDLDDGESEVLTFTYNVSDGTTAVPNTVSVTITGSNDAPVVSAIATTRGEDSGAVTVDLLAGQTDVDVEALSAVSLAQTGGRNVGASIDANGNLIFAGGQFEDLDDGESEVLTFTYDVSDGTTVTQNTVSVTITGANDAPTVSAIATTRGEDSGAVTVDLLAGQTDVDVEALSAVSLAQTGGRNVGASIDANGNLIFAGGQFEDLDDGESEVLTFTYDVSDGTTVTQNTVSVKITGSNDAPTVSAIATTRGEDSGAVSVDLLAGQTDVDVEALSAVSLSQTGGRTVGASIDANGNLIFAGGQFEDLDDGESEVLTFTYDVSDGTTVTQNTVSVTITGANDAPTVSAIATTRGEDSGAVSVDLLAGQTDIDVEALSAVSLAQTGGRNVGASIDANGNLIFAGGQFEDLDDGESEVLTFTYDVSDGTTVTQNTVSVTITGSNDAPSVAAVTQTLGEDAASFSVDLLAGQSDVDVEALTAVSLTQTGGRTVGASIDANGNLVFASGQFEDLAAGQSEVLTFTYGVSDGTATTQNTVTLTVTGTNDAPMLFGPGALSTTGTGTNGNDASFSYAVASNFDTFPTQAGTVETWVKTTDTSGALISYAVPGSPNELWITLNGGNIQVWLNNSNQGSVNAGSLTDGEWHHVALSFGDGANDTVLYIDGAPVMSLGATNALTSGGTLVMGSDQDSVGGSFETSQALDADFDGLRVWNGVRSEAQIQATMGTALDPVVNPDLVADYGFDGSLESNVPGAPTMTLNNAVIVNDDAYMAGNEDTGIPLSGLVALDIDNAPLTVTLQGTNGTISADQGGGAAVVQIVGHTVTITGHPVDVQMALQTAVFTGDANFNGDASVSVTVDDGVAAPVTTDIAIRVAPVNDAPVGLAAAPVLSLDGNFGAVEIAHDAAIDVHSNVAFTMEMMINPDTTSVFQTIIDKSDTTLGDYSPYRVHLTANGGISIWNGGTPIDSPAGVIQAGVWQHIATSFDGTTMRIFVDGNEVVSQAFTLGNPNTSNWNIGKDSQAGRNFDGQIDDVRLWSGALDSADLGGAILNSANTPNLLAHWTFDAAPGGVVTDQTGNGHDGTLVAGAAITGTSGTQMTLAEDGTISGMLTAADADLDALTFQVTGNAANGTVNVEANGAYTYTPDPDFNGTDSFTVQVSDGNGGVATQVFTVNVTAVNDAPDVSAVTTSAGEDSGAVSVNLLAGQTDVDGDALSAVSLTQTGGRNVGASIDANGNLVFAGGQFEDLALGGSEVLTFTYNVSDGTTTTPNTVSITMTGANDAPIVTAPSTLTNLGAEFTVHTTTVGDQAYPAMGVLPDGGYVVTWSSQNVDGSGHAIMFQRMAADGTPVGAETRASTYAAGDQINSEIATHADGSFTIVWSSNGQDGSDWSVQAQRFNADGTPNGAEFQLNTDVTIGTQVHPHIQAMPDGGDLIIWSAYNVDGSASAVMMRRFDADGNELTAGPTRVNTTTAGEQYVWTEHGSPMAVYDDGSYVITWASQNVDGSGYAMVAQRYDAAGTPSGGQFQVNTSTLNDQHTGSVAVLDNGNTVFTWSSLMSDGTSWQIHKQVYDAAMNPVGGETTVNTTAAGNQFFPEIAVLTSGNYVIAWTSDVGDGSSYGVFAQEYDADGVAVGGERQLNTFTAGEQRNVKIIPTPDGGYIAGWNSFGQDGSGWSFTLRDAEGGGLSGDENSTFSISGITVADTDGDSLTVTVSVPDGTLSANGGAVSGTSVVLTGTAAAVNASLSSLMFTPAPDTNGLVDVTVSVNDGTTVTTQTVPVSVQSTNQAPAISGDYTNVTAIADFNGTNAYIDVPDATVNGLTAGTIETWVYLDTNTQETVFAQQANGVNSLAIFRIGDGTPGQVTFQGSNQSGLLTSNSTIPTGEWHHVAITFNGSQANLYIDGQHDASLAGNFGIVGASGGQITGTSIGAWLGDGSGRYFDGQMSEFRIWDHVRSGTEIEDNYQARLTGTEDGLRALYNFTDGFAAGGAVADATGTYDAVSVNATGTFDETFTVAMASEDFEGGASGWSNNSTTYTGTVLTDFLGSFGNGGATSKTFTLPAGANETTISFDFYKMDSWDGENFQIQIGGQTVAARSFNFSTGVASPVGGIDDTVAVTFSDGVDHGAIVNAGWNDYSFRVELTLSEAQIAALPVDANGNPMLQLGFTSTLDQGITDESWGIDNLSISAEIPVDGIEAGSGVLQSNLLSDASDPDGDALSVSNVSFSSSNAARTVSFTVDAMTGVLSIDTAQFANLGAGRSETITVTYDVVDPEGATATGSRSFTINGTQNAISLGSSDYVEIDHHGDLEPGAGDMTAEMWFYWPGAGGVSGLQFLMSKGNTDGSTDPGYSLFMNGNTLVARTSTGAGQGELEVDMSGIDAGWHHVAMVIDQSSDPTDGQLTAYLDGSTAGWQIAGGGYDDVWTKGDISSAADALMIGDPAYSPSAQGSGYTHPMDEVRIWDNARTEVEINQTMHQQLNGNEAGLSGYWTFNESVGSTVTDLTGNGHDGTMSANAARENLIELSISNNEVYRGLLMGSDAEGDALSYSISTGPQHGSVSFDGNTFVYDHDGSGFSDSFTVEISDGTDTVTEQIDVTVV